MLLTLSSQDSHDHGDHSGGSGHSHNMSGVFLVCPFYSLTTVILTISQHVMADTLGSVGVIISTLLINR